MNEQVRTASIRFHFDNSYARLPEKFFSFRAPTPVKAPVLVLFNAALAAELGIEHQNSNEDELAAVFSGNLIPEGATPLAQAYAGHQFGHFTMLGDGRAILLGEQITPTGLRYDLQFKGSGRTPYSRGGDGRATLSSMLREYIMSEAMHHLGIPGSRSLAVVASGEEVYRNRAQPGAVLTRVMPSHLRVGTFEYARQYLSENELSALLHYTIDRHYPQLADAENPALALLEAAMHKQVSLVSQWMRVGFIHGVMNTDNMSIAGLTFDYGPCAFMNAYHPSTVFSSIDHAGRYAFGQQASMAQWNLGALAGALLPLIHPETEEAIEMARDLLNSFPVHFGKMWNYTLRQKLGLLSQREDDQALANALLNWMQEAEADYTNTFVALMEPSLPSAGLYQSAAFQQWHHSWLERVGQQEGGWTAAQALMQKHNPRYIPRNHMVEEALQAAAERNDLRPFEDLLKVLSTPYTGQQGAEIYTMPPASEKGYQTFCGT